MARRDPFFASCGALSLLEIFRRSEKFKEFDELSFDITKMCGKFVLDVGCGWGRILVPIAKHTSVCGLDISSEMLRLAKKYAQQEGVSVNLIAGDAAYLPFKTNAFDLVYSYLVLQHLPKERVEIASREVARVLKPRAEAFFYFPNLFGFDGILAKIFYEFMKLPSAWGPASVRYYTLPELHFMFSKCFSSVITYARGFRPPLIYSKDRVLFPWLTSLFFKNSGHIEKLANSKLTFLKNLALGFEIIVEK